MNRRNRWRRLRFEGLETRILLAADLFVPLDDPVTQICIDSYAEVDSDQANADHDVVSGLNVSISDADRGSQEDLVISDLAFAELGSQLTAEQPFE
jgi:hypothetical protein